MDYFIMKTDRRLRRLPRIRMPEGFSPTKGKETVVAYVEKSRGLSIDYPDFLEKPWPLIADKFQRILQKYQQDMACQRIVLVEKETGRQSPYCRMQPPEILCAHREESGYDARGDVARLVLDPEKVEGQKIFLAGDYRGQLLVGLDVAESILRRDAAGIWFEPVKTAGRSG